MIGKLKKHIYLASPHMSEQGYEQEYINEAFETNWIAPLGKNVDEFEKGMAQKLGAKAGVALTTGTAAIHLALKTVGVGKGDIVFCQSLTFSASANPITYQNATPVFIDSDEETWNMSPDALERAFEKYPNAKAVIVVHLYGMAADLDKILEICNRHCIPLIEDAAESLGTTYKGRYTGTFGHLGIISFNGNKIITTSGGGMLLLNGDNAEAEAKKARFWATQSRDPARHYQHSEIGYNYRMSNIVAGIGRGQLKVLDDRVEKKRYIYNYYQEHIGDLDGLHLMPMHEWVRSNCWLTALTLSGKITPEMLINALEEDDVESRPIWKPMHLQPAFAEYDYIDNGGVAQNIFENGVCLPSDTNMTDGDLERVCAGILRLWA
ncbi:MAG: aminotransferase class I/II-fold pyridoxal phosphate-dependent enzyme [Oscillospiraceae bacterium]|nr:aminotransferase class I/II-fold pyridoxal phosphate-dependent enzyme [Oscillospiraceae bacterium]MDD4414993.1 aminotransferase class I/II-fold pyridoxal phosphate-dependent enzyme [Oscillospiraceae bacterium]